MPIIIPKDIPAYSVMQKENIFVMTKKRAYAQDIRPIEIAILNLMPTKIQTETQLIRLLSNSPLQINITLLSTETYTGKNTSKEHLDKFYKNFSEVKGVHFDGMIITGAPVETLDYEKVDYWKELTEIMDYADQYVTSTIYICWGAQAAMYYHYGLQKQTLPEKLFGIFACNKQSEFDPLLKGFDDVFYIPHSRYTAISDEDVLSCDKLKILAYSSDAGCSIVKSRDNKKIFLFGHSEYDRDTLQNEYYRDLEKGLKIDPPKNYFIDEARSNINMCWKSTANLLFSNWLNYYIYQVTPYHFQST